MLELDVQRAVAWFGRGYRSAKLLLAALGIVVAFQAHALLPDSVRMQMLAMLARGDVAGAVELYQVATGTESVPRWLGAFQAAFSAANQSTRCPMELSGPSRTTAITSPCASANVPTMHIQGQPG